MRTADFYKPIRQVIHEALKGKMLIEDDRIMPMDTTTKRPLTNAERQKLRRLAKSKGYDLSPQSVTREQIIAAAKQPHVAAEMLVTDDTTDEELSAMIRGNRSA